MWLSTLSVTCFAGTVAFFVIAIFPGSRGLRLIQTSVLFCSRKFKQCLIFTVDSIVRELRGPLPKAAAPDATSQETVVQKFPLSEFIKPLVMTSISEGGTLITPPNPPTIPRTNTCSPVHMCTCTTDHTSVGMFKKPCLSRVGSPNVAKRECYTGFPSGSKTRFGSSSTRSPTMSPTRPTTKIFTRASSRQLAEIKQPNCTLSSRLVYGVRYVLTVPRKPAQ